VDIIDEKQQAKKATNNPKKMATKMARRRLTTDNAF
jgi:hypothetical protein